MEVILMSNTFLFSQTLMKMARFPTKNLLKFSWILNTQTLSLNRESKIKKFFQKNSTNKMNPMLLISLKVCLEQMLILLTWLLKDLLIIIKQKQEAIRVLIHFKLMEIKAKATNQNINSPNIMEKNRNQLKHLMI